jgi:hypothetical protein
LICLKVLNHTNHFTVARFVNDRLKMLWHTGLNFVFSCCGIYAEKCNTLKVFYPNLIHFTCLAHGLQRVAEEVRAKFPQVIKLISMTKKCFWKLHTECNHRSSTCQM